MLALFQHLPLQFQCGDDWRYSNSGYAVLGAIIEAVTGVSWAEAIEQHIGMPLSLSSLAIDPGAEPAPLMAKGYTGRENVVEAQDLHSSFPHAAGAPDSDINDLATWAYALHHGQIITDSSYGLMTNQTRLNNGDVQDYGFGLFTSVDGAGRATIGHSGGIYGFSTDSLYYPPEDVFIAVLANSAKPMSDPSSVLRALAEVLLGGECIACTP